MAKGGRYSPPGVPIVPLASEPGLAVLIALRYLPPNREEWPTDFVLGWTEVDVEPERLVDVGDEAAVRAAVLKWISEERALLAAVSSRVLPEADVVLLNPRHSQAREVPALRTRPFDFAACLHEPPMLEHFRSAS